MTTQTKPKKRQIYSWKRFAMDAARFVCIPLLLLYRMKRLTPTGEPYKARLHGGAILAANHTSFSDPFLIGVAFWYRRMHFLAAEVVMTGKLRSWLLRGVGAIRIDRNNADIDAMHSCVEVLKNGDLLAMFPQGNIAKEDQLQSLKSGVTLIALQAGVPIVPMYICPAKRWYNRRTVVIGEPLNPKDYITRKFPSTADIEAITQKLLDEINRCASHQ